MQNLITYYLGIFIIEFTRWSLIGAAVFLLVTISVCLLIFLNMIFKFGGYALNDRLLYKLDELHSVLMKYIPFTLFVTLVSCMVYFLALIMGY